MISIHVLSIHIVQVVRIKDGNHKVCILGISSILQLFCLGLLKTFDMLLSFRIDFCQFFLLLFAFIAVFFLYIGTPCLDLFRDLLIRAEFLVNLLLSLISLCNEHFPPSHIVHGLILMCKQVPFDKRTVLHCHLFPLTFYCAFTLQIGKGNLNFAILLLVFVVTSRSSCSTLASSFVGISPAGELSRLNDNTSEKFAESIKKFTLFLTCLNHVSILWECSLQTMVDSL